ncbi:DUF378 domain-containing protein [Candidatus Wolfebacteria bacterium]|nr:DUF378 domain-containing protein [Candidatus Wolfebacteria bacterium]
MKILKNIAWVLVIIGGLNWGLIGLFGFDLVATIFGDMSIASKLVYDLVGLSAVYLIIAFFVKPKSKSSPVQIPTV